MMNRCFFLPQNWNANIRSLIGGLTLFYFLFMFPGLVEALQTALVRTSDGDVYQIRFRNKEPRRAGYDLDDFVRDFSIYDQSGRVKLCPGNDDEITWELYAAARLLAKTPRRTPLFDTSPLVKALEQAVTDQDLAPTKIAEKLAVQEVVGHITSGIQDHTFLKSLNVVPKGGPVAVIAIPATWISKLGNIEIRMRKLLYAFWIASVHADTTRVLQEDANQKAAELWDAIERGQIVDIFGGSVKVGRGEVDVSGNISIEIPLRLRLAAQVYQENAERAAEMGADLGKSDNAWFSWLLGLSGIGDVLALVASPVDALRLKNALQDLEASTGNKIARSIRLNVQDLYDSASWDLDWNGFCSPRLKFTAAYTDVYEGNTLTYNVSLNSPPDSVATITISSDNSDATVLPTVLTFTSKDWYTPKVVSVRAAEDTDDINDRVYLSHTSRGYEEGRIYKISFTIVDRKGNSFPESVKTIGPLTLLLGDDFRLDLASYFRDPENAKLNYWAHSEDIDVVTALPDRSGSWITINPWKIGRTTVTAGATDPGGLRVAQTFTVTVTAASVNDAPTASNKISDPTPNSPDTDLPTPDIPETEGPSTPDTPETEVPETPDISTTEVPENPDIPITEVPEPPDIPITEVPENPDIPTTEAPESPEIPITEAPESPDIPTTEAPESPEIPTTEVPENPDISITEVPESPDIPTTEVPENPDISITEAPETPIIPTTEAPETPDIPITEVPETPIIPIIEVPEPPDIPITEVPEPPDIPTTEVPETPEIPITETPESPEIPITEVPENPDIPTTEAPETPDIPTTEVPETPDIPITEVPEPPDIPTTEVPEPPEIPTTEVPETPDIPITEVPEPPEIPTTEVPEPPEIPTTEVPKTPIIPSFNLNFGGGNTRTENICDRTQQVLNAILGAMDIDDCANVESDDLDSITALVLSDTEITALQENDLEGLNSLEDLDLHGNSLSSLSVGLFDGLRALKTLDLKENSLRSLPVDVFDELGSLRRLDLKDNGLIALPVGVFDGLKALESLNLKGNQLTTLPKGIFDNILDTLKSDALSLDDALKTTFNFSTTTQNAAEGDTVRVTVTLGHSLPVAIRVPYTISGTATASDYTNLQPRTELLFLAGETSKEIVFTLLEDTDTTAETVLLKLGELRDVKVRKSDGTRPNAKLSASAFLNPPQQRVHTTTVTTDGRGIPRPMYWTGDNKIYRSKLDGTHVQVLFEGGNPGDIALDVSGGKMYWIDTNMNAILRAKLDGSSVVNLVTDLENPAGIALDISGGKIYWTDTETGKIQRANLNGSGIENLVSGLKQPYRLALDVLRGKMYWTDPRTGKVQRANLNGTSVEDFVIGLRTPIGIALDVSRGKIYWIDSRRNKIQRANLNGSEIENLVTSLYIGDATLTLDISGGKMYWADKQYNKIYRANLNGSRIERLYSGSLPVGIALAIEAGAGVRAAPLAVRSNAASRFLLETALLPNYPNPFNPETWIPYRLATPADVSIAIYTADGKLVRTLDLGNQPVGIYESRSRAAYWDGKNALGEPVASGVYFYTLTAGEFTATRKMLIRK